MQELRDVIEDMKRKRQAEHLKAKASQAEVNSEIENLQEQISLVQQSIKVGYCNRIVTSYFLIGSCIITRRILRRAKNVRCHNILFVIQDESIYVNCAFKMLYICTRILIVKRKSYTFCASLLSGLSVNFNFICML